MIDQLHPKLEQERREYDEYMASFPKQQTPYNEYKTKVTELKNMRIQSFLKGKL